MKEKKSCDCGKKFILFDGTPNDKITNSVFGNTENKTKQQKPFSIYFTLLLKEKQLVVVMHAENSKISVILTVLKTVNWWTFGDSVQQQSFKCIRHESWYL